ncbi:MAG: histidine phosphatase family protein [Rubrivivax sp.]
MRLLLIRHGRPAEGDAADPGLRADGREQAAAVAALLAQEPVTHVVSSPLRRALETAAPLAERLGLPVTVIDGWAEADRHGARYRSTETLRALGAAEWVKFLADPVRYVGGDPDRFNAAVMEALAATMVLQGPGGTPARVAVFTHGLPINLVLAHALGLRRLTHFPPWYGSLSRLHGRTPADLSVVSVNETVHQTSLVLS